MLMFLLIPPYFKGLPILMLLICLGNVYFILQPANNFIDIYFAYVLFFTLGDSVSNLVSDILRIGKSLYASTVKQTIGGKEF